MSYYYDGSDALAFLGGLGIAGAVLSLVILVCVIVAYFLLLGLLVRAVKAKGHHRNGAGALWFVGVIGLFSLVFALPALVGLGLYAIALPDRGREADAAEQGFSVPNGAPVCPPGYTTQP